MFNRTGLLLLALILLCGMLLMTAQSGVRAQDDPTPTPEPDEESTEYSFAWPIEPPSDDQIETARDCDAQALASERYLVSEGVDVNDFADAYPLEEDCDFATLVVAYFLATEEGEEPHENAVAVINELIERNPALIFYDYIYDGFVGQIENLVAPPPFASEEITGMTIHHTYAGIGSNIEYEVSLERDGDVFSISGEFIPEFEADPEPFTSEVSAELVDNLVDNLSDFVPVGETAKITACYDNYPDWEVTITFTDGTEIDLYTSGSNFFNFGGPWYVELDDQSYVQFSVAFVAAFFELIEAADMPRGTTAAMACFYEGNLLQFFFPPDEDETTEESS